MTSKILVIDDDRKTVELVKLYLENEGYFVFSAHDGQSAVQIAKKHVPDLIVLDLMIPKLDGIEVCRAIRTDSEVPIIMLTARTTEEDKLIGLNLGADDYITKPFSPREMLARVKAVLRRSRSTERNGHTTIQIIQLQDLVIDPARHEATVDGRPLALTPKEFQLLELFARHPGRAFNRLELMVQAFGKDYEGLERTIDVHVMNLRKKLESIPNSKTGIKTVYGIGYKLTEK
ncbi:MAG TPA: response regulator transcription factor [Anaerolineales bacterium]|nr:response regulator transcription factor [Anaerolineales bacterium]